MNYMERKCLAALIQAIDAYCAAAECNVARDWLNCQRAGHYLLRQVSRSK
jgi:hypothetical protein